MGFEDYAVSSGPGVVSPVTTTVNTVYINNNNNINSGARTSPQAASPHAATPYAVVMCSRRPPADAPLRRCTGKFCSTAGGVGSDNPSDPTNLMALEKSKAVSFFFRDFSKFDVSDALAARTAARRVGRAQRKVHPGRRALGSQRSPPPDVVRRLPSR